MSEVVACLIAFIWGSLMLVVLFLYATKARCGKSEKCRQAFHDIRHAPDWPSRIGTSILYSPLLWMIGIKSLALAFGGLIVTMVGYVCGIETWAWLIKWLDRALELLFDSGDAQPNKSGL